MDDHFLETVPASIIVAVILYFSFRYRVQHSYRWRMFISAVLAVGTAPLVLPDISGGFAVPHVFPAFIFFPHALSEPSSYSLRGIGAASLLILGPFTLTTLLIYFLWFMVRRSMCKYERPAA
jgi:hypothetical protein